MKKSNLERAQEFAQECISMTPAIILGSGASAAHGIPGMLRLAEHLKSTTPTSMLPDEKKGWGDFLSLLDTSDLETALTRVSLSDALTAHIVESTRSFLFPFDENVFQSVIADRRHLPLTRLYRYLFRSTHKTIHVITPNYDRIAEYAADAGEISHFCGFSYGHLGTRSKDATARVYQNGHAVRTVCIWKVHGSLDWFKDSAGQVIAAPLCRGTPAHHLPAMITPGTEKYRLAYNEPFRTIVGCSDVALERARSYLCLGFGFNDDHLQTKLIERCDSSAAPIVIVTKELTSAAKKFLFGGRCRRFLALEQSSTGTRMFSHDDTSGVDLSGEEIWQLENFLDMSIGIEK